MKQIIILLAFMGIFASCISLKSNLEVNIQNNYEEIIIENKYGWGVYGLYCKINGKVSGVLEIQFTNGENLSERIIPKNGIINFIYEGDWYADEFIIKLLPEENVSGYINIVYKFSTLKPLTIY